MTKTPSTGIVLARVSWFLFGGLVAGMVALDPWNLLPFDEWVRGGEAHEHGTPAASLTSTSQTPSAKREILFYRNPMDPTITSPVMTQDAMGMDYIPVYANEAEAIKGAGSVVQIDSMVVQKMNVQSVEVKRRDISHQIRTVGYLEYDQERMVTVTTKYSGWVEKVYANYVGEPVEAGQALFEVYSPELVQTQQELLFSLQYSARFENAEDEVRQRAEALADAARTRLGYWDISPEQIQELEQSGEILRTLQVVAPTSGLIMKRMPGLEGMAVRPGMEIFHIANLSTLWLSVEVFEDQLAWIRQGTPAVVSFTYFPGKSFHGRVRFIEPEFSEQTRTLRVKLEVPNPGGRLRSGMFATVVFSPIKARQALAVPSLAVLRTGQRNVLVIDLGGGRFEAREVILGQEGEGWVEVLEGLVEGDRIVTSAQFLIDSEASLQEAVQKMMSSRRTHSGVGGGAPAMESPAGTDSHEGMEADEDTELPAGEERHEHGGGRIGASAC